MNYDELDPGIRETVRWLTSLGFTTCDSGDGATKFDDDPNNFLAPELPDLDEDDGCALPFPNVAIRVEDPSLMIAEADKLFAAIHESGQVEAQGVGFVPCIQASYDPANGIAMVVLMNVDDDFLRMIGTIPSPNFGLEAVEDMVPMTVE